jgi:hypothetical protein
MGFCEIAPLNFRPLTAEFGAKTALRAVIIVKKRMLLFGSRLFSAD